MRKNIHIRIFIGILSYFTSQLNQNGFFWQNLLLVKFINPILKLRKYFLITINRNIRDNEISCNQSRDIKISQKHECFTGNNFSTSAVAHKVGVWSLNLSWP